MKLGVRGLGVLVGAAGLALAGVSLPAVAVAQTAAPAHAAGARNPYSPAYGHAYRHGVIPTVGQQHKIKAWDAAHPAPATTGPNTLSYGGGVDGIGVQSGHSKVYLVFYGNQWGTSSTDANGNLKFTGDPSGVASPTQQMFRGIGTNGERWSADLTQWCDGPSVAVGATSCPANANFVPYMSGGVLSGVYYDNAAPSPASASATQLANEAIKAAQHFGNTTAASNRYAYYVILSPHNTNPDNWQTGGYCAWHDYTGDYGITGTYRDLAFSNQPYNTDAGSSCGVGFVNFPGTTDGYTMTLGHEWHEMVSDQNPAGGWTNHTGSAQNGEENSDECAWISPGQPGGAANISFGSFGSYAEQSSWSNDTNSCAISHAIVTHSAVTVTNPGNKSSVVNLATSLQINASDANGKTLSYSATGLPTGLTINATSGLISGTPTAVGTYSVVVTAKDTDNATGTASFTWTITTAGCSGQLIANKGFESGTASWSGTTTSIFTDGAHAHSGVGYAWLDGYGDGVSHTESLYQTHSVKAGCHATLTFYLWINSDEGTTTAYDKLYIKANGTTVKTYSNIQQGTAYVKRTIDLSAYAGTSLKLVFTGTEDASLQTSFFLDDITLTLS